MTCAATNFEHQGPTCSRLHRVGSSPSPGAGRDHDAFGFLHGSGPSQGPQGIQWCDSTGVTRPLPHKGRHRSGHGAARLGGRRQ